MSAAEAEDRPQTIAETSQIAYDTVAVRAGDTELAGLVRRAVEDAYRTGWHRALRGNADAPAAVRDALTKETK